MLQVVTATLLPLHVIGLIAAIQVAAGAKVVEVSGTGAVLPAASTASSSANAIGARAAALAADGSVLQESALTEVEGVAEQDPAPGLVVRGISAQVLWPAAAANTTPAVVVRPATCNRVLEKARRLLELSQLRLRELGRSREQRRFQWEALQDLRDRRVNDQVILKVQAALGQMSLRVALQSGDVWTAQDQFDLNKLCMSGPMQPARPLEEQDMTSFGEAIYQGDMLTGSDVPPQAASKRLWENGMVSYCYTNSTSSGARIAVEEAMEHISSQVPCISFRHVGLRNATSCTELPSVIISSNWDGCWAHVGQVSDNAPTYRGRSQLLNLGRGCEMRGMAIHQLAHTLGMTHMATRIDRDLHLRVLEDNISPTRLNTSFLLNSNPPPIAAYSAQSFDFLSITMYPARAFTLNNSVLALEPQKEPLLSRFLGQRISLSQLDVEDLANEYRCLSRVRPLDISKGISRLFLNGSGLLFDGSCTDKSYTGIEFLDAQNQTRLFQCSDLSERCYDTVLGERARLVCPQRCLGCIAATPDAIQLEAQRRARKIVVANITETLPPVTVCVDAVETGIRFRNGGKASCADLANYCDHPSLGRRVKMACALTCGRCKLENNDFVNATGQIDEGCVDQPATAKPVMMIGGQPALCREIKAFCVGHPKSEFVVKKCPVTCGFCDPTLSTTLEVRPTTTVTTTSWTGTYTFSTSMDESKEGVGCSRRRRWGFCYTRRRRIT